MSKPTPFEKAVQECYSTWSGSYYDEYYGEKAPYPPVHRDILIRLLKEHGATNLLDAGCGPASFLRDVDGIDLYGFDLTPEMVTEAQRVLAQKGVPPAHIWQGSVASAEAFHAPGEPGLRFDAAVCVGVLPHIPAELDTAVLRNLAGALQPGGLGVVEARNQFFSLFTLNRYTCQFFNEDLVQADELRRRAGDEASQLEEVLEALEKMFRTDLPPLRKGKQGEPGYDEVLSRTHNPLLLKEQMAAAGFEDVRLLFYHYHCLPPMFEKHIPQMFRAASLAMENPEDWRGYFMASSFLVAGRRASSTLASRGVNPQP